MYWRLWCFTKPVRNYISTYRKFWQVAFHCNFSFFQKRTSWSLEHSGKHLNLMAGCRDTSNLTLISCIRNQLQKDMILAVSEFRRIFICAEMFSKWLNTELLIYQTVDNNLQSNLRGFVLTLWYISRRKSFFLKMFILYCGFKWTNHTFNQNRNLSWLKVNFTNFFYYHTHHLKEANLLISIEIGLFLIVCFFHHWHTQCR